MIEKQLKCIDSWGKMLYYYDIFAFNNFKKLANIEWGHNFKCFVLFKVMEDELREMWKILNESTEQTCAKLVSGTITAQKS